MKPFLLLTLLSPLLNAGALANESPTGVQAARDATPTKAGVVSFTVTAPGYQKGANKLEVLCPEAMPAGRRFPVLIVLPVNTGIDGQWGSPIEEMRKLNIHNTHQVICVVPSYDVEPWFGDMPAAPTDGSPRIRQQAYITDVVVPLLDREFPTLAERAGRYVIGFSKSGFGAFGLLLRNPGMFERAAIYDCADPTPKADIFTPWGMSASYGSRENFDKKFHIPTLLTENKAHFQGKSRRIALMAGGLSYGGVEAIHAAIKENQIGYTYLVFPGMGHSWREGWLKLAAAAILPVPPAAGL